MRPLLVGLLVAVPILLYSQRSKDVVSMKLDDAPLETILDSISAQTSYFFSYNADLFPKGSKYSIQAIDEPVDKLLSRLLIGTNLKYSFYKDQIILNYQPPEEQVIRKKNFFTITGKVRDADGNPLAGVNIFLDGTSIGSFSDIDGNYTLESIPPGFFDIVFSHVGYKSGVYRITEYHGGSRIQNHQLQEELEELEEIEVFSNRIKSGEDSWSEHYKVFREEVLGNSKIAQQCVIENPEVINFLSEDDHALTAFADDVIIIRNDALGYRIDYFLESFERKENDLRFRGKMRFRNQEPMNSKERREWKKNRRLSYSGSFNHFKKSLLREELRKSGFRIYSSNVLSRSRKNGRKMELSEKDLLTYKGDSYELSFANNLIVEYKREKETVDYLKKNIDSDRYYSQYLSADGMLIKDPENQISMIKLLKSPVRIDLTGQIVDRFAISTYGYWSWERIGDLVPINYDPKWDNL